VISSILLAVALSASTRTVPQTVSKASLDAMTGFSTLRSASLSPDGTLVYLLTSDRQLEVLDTESLKPLGSPASWPSGIFSFFPTRLPGVLATLEVGQEPPKVAIRNVLAPSGRNDMRIPLLEGRISAVDRPYAGDFHVITKSSAGEWHLNNIAVDSGVVTSEPLDRHALNFAFRPGNVPGAFLQNDGKGAFWRPINCTLPKCPSLNTGRHGELEIGDPINVLADGGGANFWAFKNGDRAVPVHWSWSSGTVQLIGEVTDADISDLLIDPATGSIQAYAGGMLERRWTVVDSAVEKSLRFLDEAHRGFPRVLDRSIDGKTWLVTFLAPSEPSRLFLYRPLKEALTALPGQQAAQNDEAVPQTRFVLATSIDGLRIPAYLAPPAKAACDADKERCGLVVLIHGGPQHRDENIFSKDVALLQRMGLWVLRVNFRGSTGFGKKFVERADGEWGSLISWDVISAIKTATALRGVDPKKVCALGESFGGFTALNVASLRPDLIACAASLNGGGDLEAFVRDVVSQRPDLKKDLFRQIADPDTPDGAATIHRQSPMTRLSALKMPLLLAYGENDNVTPISQTEGLSKGLGALKTVTVMSFPKQAHVLSAETQQVYWSALANFLAHTIGANASIAMQYTDASVHISGNLNQIEALDTKSGD